MLDQCQHANTDVLSLRLQTFPNDLLVSERYALIQIAL